MKHATQMKIDFMHYGNYDEDAIIKLVTRALQGHGLEFLGADFESMDEVYKAYPDYLDDTIQFDTYPDMFTDYENLIENENYDYEHRVFEVPRDWALEWISKNARYDDGFWNEYTYDDTFQMYEDACKAGVLISEAIEPEHYKEEETK